MAQHTGRQQLTSVGQRVSPEMQKCIDNCLDCHSVCTETVNYCLQKGGPHAEPNHIRLLLDCAEICQTSADFMLRGSDLHHETCGVCADVCEQCAADCDHFGDDKVMKACADTCRKCAQSCRQMAGGTHHRMAA